MTHAEARAMGMAKLAALENAAMRGGTGIKLTPQVKTETARFNTSQANIRRHAAARKVLRAKITGYLSRHPNAKAKDIAEFVGLCDDTVRQHLTTMAEDGMVIRCGAHNRLTWVLA